MESYPRQPAAVNSFPVDKFTQEKKALPPFDGAKWVAKAPLPDGAVVVA